MSGVAVIALFAAVFLTPIAAGVAAWLFTACRDRRRLDRAFAQGRCESIIHLPQPVSAGVWRVHVAVAGETAA